MEDENADRVYVPGTNGTEPDRDVEPFWPPEELNAPVHGGKPVPRDAPQAFPLPPAPPVTQPQADSGVYRPQDRVVTPPRLPQPPPQPQVPRPGPDGSTAQPWPNIPPRTPSPADAGHFSGSAHVSPAPTTADASAQTPFPAPDAPPAFSAPVSGGPPPDGPSSATDSPWAQPPQRPTQADGGPGSRTDASGSVPRSAALSSSGPTHFPTVTSRQHAEGQHADGQHAEGGDEQSSGAVYRAGPVGPDTPRPLGGQAAGPQAGGAPPSSPRAAGPPVSGPAQTAPPHAGPHQAGPHQPGPQRNGDGQTGTPSATAPPHQATPSRPGPQQAGPQPGVPHPPVPNQAGPPPHQPPPHQVPPHQGPAHPGQPHQGLPAPWPVEQQQPWAANGQPPPVPGPFPPTIDPRAASARPQPPQQGEQPPGPNQQPPSVDPYQQLPWASDGMPTAEEFARRRLAKPAEPTATMGARAMLQKGTMGLVRLAPGKREQEYKQDVEMVRRNFGGLRQVTVVNPKGGAGKTVAVLLLAMTFGQKRGGYVLAWDNNETQGTLGMRAQQDFHARTVRDMMRDLHLFRGSHGRVGDLSQYVRAQGEGMFDVLASDESATAGEMLTASAFAEIREIVSRFYKLIFVDTGNNVRAQNWQAAMDATDQLVITMSARNDSAETAARMLDHLEQSGRQRLVRQAVSVVTMPPTRKDIDLPAIQRHFAARTRAVLLAPYEKLIDSGEPLRYGHLSNGTRDSWLKIAAAVAEGL